MTGGSPDAGVFAKTLVKVGAGAIRRRIPGIRDSARSHDFPVRGCIPGSDWLYYAP
jgi:hypothetical protein